MQKRRLLLAMLLCAFWLTGFAQKTVTGTVKDANGEPMIGVSVTVDGTSNGAVTDFNGNFSVPNVSPSSTLKITYIGYQEQKVTVGNQSVINIVMKEDSQQLDELVVVGYGVVKKSDLTGAIGSVRSDDITAKGSTNLAGGLQGAVAGVNISQASSRAGESFSMQIRGKSSLQGGEPLYVVDGIVCDNINFLNPMDIEKVDVLKDASSTAIYGSRATNGVLMITTKKGTNMGDQAKAVVSYDGYYGWKTTANMPDFMSGDEWMNYRFSRYLMRTTDNATGVTTWAMTPAQEKLVWCNFSPVWQDEYATKNYTDWVDLVTRNGSEQNHFVNITGSTRNLSYRVGLGYQKEEGVLYDAYERWNAKAAVDHKINEHWATGASFNLSTSLKNSGSSNSVFTGFHMNPLMKAYYWDGDNAGQIIRQPGKDAAIYPNGGGPTSTLNPLLDRENSKDDTRTYNAMGNMYLQYSPIKEVILKTTLSPSYQKSHHGIFYAGQNTEKRASGTNYTETYNDEVFSYTWDTQANFIKSWGDHTLNALGLVSVYEQKFEGNSMTVVDMPFESDWYNVGSGSVQSQDSYYKKISMLSYVLRLNYDYKGLYYLTVSSRWDGSSKFQEGNRWGMFPSAAVAWRLSEEKFMEKTKDWLSNLKLRLSFGITGNNGAVGAYQTQLLANTKYYYNFGNTVANGYGYELANSDLTWEKTTEFDLGLDFGFLGNRINGSIDFYSRTSRDLLMEMETPLEMGSTTGSIWGNVGKVRNTGIEVQLNTVNIKTKDWNWTTNFTFAHNKNKILELNGGTEDMVGNWWFIGQPIDVVYGYQYTGVCTADEAKAYAADASKVTKFNEGEMKAADLNDDGVVNDSDRKVLGHAEPTWTGSLNSTLTWKNLDFSFSIYTSQGSTVYSPFIAQYTSYGDRGRERLKFDYYIPDGAPILGADGQITYQQGTHYGAYPFPSQNGTNAGGGVVWANGNNKNPMNFVDNSFTKVKNIVLGYTLPKAWTSKVGVSSLRVYVNFVNPFTFTDYKGFDPEWADASVSDGKGGPASRSYQVGVNLKF